MNWDKLIDMPVYQFLKKDKKIIFDDNLRELAMLHYRECADYRSIINMSYKESFDKGDVPAIAVQLFKHHLLKSVSEDDIFKITTSSGTTGKQVSRIVLDKANIVRQQKILSKIVKEWLGSKRLPMLIIDHPNVIKDKFSYSARGVGIQGMSLFGHDHSYALNEDMTINFDAVSQFFDKYKDQKVFIFGFTFMVWQYFIKQLVSQQLTFQLNDAVLLHSGGWKKLLDQAVSNDAFKQQVQTTLGSVQVHNFYGMVEQTGTIYVECESGYLHCPFWSDVTILNKKTLKSEIHGIEGIIQVSSLLPSSYPGHCLLTEDLGVMLGEDNCTCGRHGKYFLVNGRLAKAEVRGCSDTQS